MATLVTLTAAQKLSVRRDLGLVKQGDGYNLFLPREVRPRSDMTAAMAAVYVLLQISDYIFDLLEHSGTLERETK